MAYSHSSTATSLSSSVQSLRTSLALLDSSISVLSTGISDFPRLNKVLTTTRHFELTPSSSLAAAQASLASELEPAISTLLSRAESHIGKLERREKGLIAKSELQEGRLGDGEFDAKEAGKERLNKSLGRASSGNAGGARERELKLKMLRQKKERLGYVVERLSLQSQHKQRQLRMSVNVPRMDEEDD